MNRWKRYASLTIICFVGKKPLHWFGHSDNILVHALIAQSVEHLAVNQGVTGSSPV